MVFSLLMNGSPLRRICEVAAIDPKTLYGKIDFLHVQCLALAADRQKQLLAGVALPRLYLATDRQDYAVNWARQQDRRNVVLHAVGTADNVAGCAFGRHVNYDPALDAVVVERAALAVVTCKPRGRFVVTRAAGSLPTIRPRSRLVVAESNRGRPTCRAPSPRPRTQRRNARMSRWRKRPVRAANYRPEACRFTPNTRSTATSSSCVNSSVGSRSCASSRI